MVEVHGPLLVSMACKQGFTVPGALCQNKNTALLGQGKGSVPRCSRDRAGDQGSTWDVLPH